MAFQGQPGPGAAEAPFGARGQKALFLSEIVERAVQGLAARFSRTSSVERIESLLERSSVQRGESVRSPAHHTTPRIVRILELGMRQGASFYVDLRGKQVITISVDYGRSRSR